MFGVVAPCITGCFNKYQILALVISTCIYQFIVQSYHNTAFSIYLMKVKRMLLLYKQCFIKIFYF
jgi:hypothetical protein